MAQFFKGEAEKNFDHDGVGKVKGNNKEWGAPRGAGSWL